SQSRWRNLPDFCIPAAVRTNATSSVHVSADVHRVGRRANAILPTFGSTRKASLSELRWDHGDMSVFTFCDAKKAEPSPRLFQIPLKFASQPSACGAGPESLP